ncbi:aldo/keto reductase [Aeoliella sp. ICT_H6.2]|uniref:Aldo/keto reductase n=1 Tax=Aeoliella straminimaris TaxID=2954799 RepID=A0A9X2F9P5_9BACT|nr:aldo/keto reductase [Aeoliella straminimaris]MCO6044213.1 aldo/keto reductase [Aeoliella straminimaris]
MPLRPLGKSGFEIAPVALGCWPIAGVTTLGTTEQDSLATIRACFDLGINHLDTAYVYGPAGESETLIRRAIEGRRDEVVIATKGGIHYEGDKMANDARPEVLYRECEESLRRLGTDRVELYYLHSPDEATPIEESAGAIRELVDAGKVRSAGVSNASLEQIQAFHSVCPLSAVQLPYNMLQRGIEEETLPWCRENGVAVTAYWVLMKGLLAGKLPRDYQFDPSDSRLKYPMYQGEEWQRNQDFLDRLRALAEAAGWSVAQLVTAWTLAQSGITAALCGAKRPAQIRESGAALDVALSPSQLAEIDQALADRGEAASNRSFK